VIPGEYHPVSVGQTVFCLALQSVIPSDFGVGQVELVLVVMLVLALIQLNFVGLFFLLAFQPLQQVVLYLLTKSQWNQNLHARS
jgi:hypothetical protein